MAPGPVQLGDDVRDRISDAGNFRESAFFDQDVERNGKGGEAVCSTGIRPGTIRIPPAQGRSLRVFSQELRNSLGVRGWG